MEKNRFLLQLSCFSRLLYTQKTTHAVYPLNLYTHSHTHTSFKNRIHQKENSYSPKGKKMEEFIFKKRKKEKQIKDGLS